jgi:hypothetical protein
MENSKDFMQRLLETLASTQEHEIDCGEVHLVIDVYAEASARGEDPAQLLPMVKHHLEMCDCCEEEYEALLRILEQDSA